MNITGHSFIGQSRSNDSSDTFQVTNPSTGEVLEPTFQSATSADLEKTVALAAAAFPSYSTTTPQDRANFLRTIAKKIDALGDEITPRMMAESALPEPRQRTRYFLRDDKSTLYG